MLSLFPSSLQELDAKIVLDVLIQHLGYYDDLRVKLEKQGGELSDLNRIADALSREFMITDRFGDGLQVSLIQPELLQQAVFLAVAEDVHLAVRQTEAGMPVYYLCRIHRDFWSEYSLIVEDLYRSPGYPSLDERFVKLMVGGHERYHLRISQFRRALAKLLLNQNETSEKKVDEILYNAGRHIYQAAWHEDQLPAVLCATHFSLPKFKQAVELLYVCLSGELCELRGMIDDNLLQFFKKIDPQPAIAGLLRVLAVTEGSTINEISEKALKLYTRLNKAFGRFLRIDVIWGERQLPVPLYKLVFANFSRLNLVSSALKKNDSLSLATTQLETEASAIIDEIVKR
ncbi:hypothetical protein L0222_13150 [bacterium]|nr:hypothetical protein [bacterium]MCI0604933.1 hypothetical protein [bacterium]